MSKGAPNEREWSVITGALALGFIALLLISAVYMPFLPWNEERKAGADVIEDTYNGENAVEEYEWFRSQWGDIQSRRAQIQNYKDELQGFYDTYGNDSSQWDDQAQTRHTRLQQRITANQNDLERLVSEYNARSDMDNRAVFKCHLPYQVDERFTIRGPPGSDPAEQPNDEYADGVEPGGEVPPPEECDGLPETASA